jgi:preprotein translocase subunit SecF
MVNFLKYRWLYFLISAVVIGSGLFSMLKWGFKYSIDFVGGTNINYQINKPINLQKLKNILSEEKIDIAELKTTDKTIFLRTSPIDEKKEVNLRKKIENGLNVQLKINQIETVGPILGREMMNKTLIAGILGLIGILIYMSFAFKGFNYAMSAVLAVFHDFLVVLGTYSILSHFFGAQLDTLFVTAVLTTMSFSVHDTIVIFDKVREYLKAEGKGSIENYTNKALTETMVRSVNNSMTNVFMLLALILLGGTTIKFFVITLLIGTITGTYSSPFVATPILVWLEKRKKK